MIIQHNHQGMGLYIHIPFCASKCAYCDFLSFEGMEQDAQARYVDALICEMESAHNKIRDTVIDTVYIGGGTPTALPSPLLCEILRETQRFNISQDAEITVEMNPGRKHNDMRVLLHDLKTHGVNRLSIGLQAWQDNLLTSIKRTHTAQDFTQTMQAARAAGFDNISVDLMFALPGQTLDHWRESIAQVISHGARHISAYSLTPAENTPLWSDLEAGKIHLPDDTTDRAMYHDAIKQLSAAGYNHYELSNFAKPGYESRHNTSYWLRKPYRGLGLGAHSFDGKTRWHNATNMTQYLNSPTFREDTETLTQQDAMAEAMILGLRMTKGVCQHGFKETFGISLRECFGKELEKLQSRGLLANTGDRIALTPLGLDLANQVFGAFI